MPIQLSDLIEYESWREAAACSGTPGVDFFPAPDDPAAVSRAKSVCASCPVSDDCLAFAIETNQPDGIWGGMTAKERAGLRRRWLRDLREAS